MPRSSILVSATALLLLPAAGAAQVPGVDLKLLPKIGAFSAINSLQELETIEGDLTSSLETSLALGLGVELDLPGLPGLRANLDYATSSKLEQEGGFVGGGTLEDVRLIAVTGDVVLRRGGLLVSPYLLLGGGLKLYDFPDEAGAPEDGSDVTGHIGAGLEVDVEFLGVFVEVSDYISRFDGTGDDSVETEARFQNDVFVMAGIRVGLF